MKSKFADAPTGGSSEALSAFDPNFERFATVTADNRLKIWDAISGSLIKECFEPAHLSTNYTSLAWGSTNASISALIQQSSSSLFPYHSCRLQMENHPITKDRKRRRLVLELGTPSSHSVPKRVWWWFGTCNAGRFISGWERKETDILPA